MPFAIFRASVLNFTLESLVPNIRISRSNGSWLFNRACNTGSRFTESMSGSSYTQVLPLKPSSMTRYSAPMPSVTGRSSVPLHYICCRGRHSPTDRCKARGYWNLRCTKYVFSLFNSPFSISVCNHPGSIRQASILGKNTITSSPWHSTYMPSSSRFTSSTL